MAHFALIYEIGPGYFEKRVPYKEGHLQAMRAAVSSGGMVLGGALGPPITGALFVFEGDGPEAAEAFARTDPYVTGGVATSWRVETYTTVVGPNASHPIG